VGRAPEISLISPFRRGNSSLPGFLFRRPAFAVAWWVRGVVTNNPQSQRACIKTV
jgi:hypothetical protein